MSYFWFQNTGGEEAWHEALSSQRAKVISEIRPAFVTVLDSLSIPDPDTWGKEDYAKMKYTGPLYFDWDAADLSDTIKPFNEFLTKLEDGGVKIEALRLYATGGRGFHCEIPEAVFNPKPSKAGVTLLPYIYKEMAMKLATDAMDLRVYTGRKGRMWRCPGVQRPNGKYKVPITLAEARAMTPELYADLTSAPRLEPLRADPELSLGLLSPMFESMRKHVDDTMKQRAKSKGDAESLAQFKGEFPPTMVRLMNGEGLVPGVGFHKVAMQLAIAANALGKSSEDLVKMCEGLVQSHQSDGDRYNSPRKRKEELRRMHEYTQDNPVYEYSKGGLKSLCAAGTSTSDLDTPTERLGVGMVQGEEEDLPEEIKTDIAAADSGMMEGLLILRSGIYRRTAEGSKQISPVSFSAPKALVDAESQEHLGVEARIYADERDLGRQIMQMNVFRTRAAMNDFCLSRGGLFSGTDSQASVISLILGRKAVKDGNTVYIVRREGLDIITDPTSTKEPRRHTIWVASDGVLGHTDEVRYRYQSRIGTAISFDADVHTADNLKDTQESRAWLTALLTMNSPTTVGLMLGWFVSCFHKQFYNAAYNQFPLLHPNGTAGSGKTQTTRLLAQMFYNTHGVKMVSASANATTAHALRTAWSSSASIPVVIDEFKPQELGLVRYDYLLQMFRLLYNQGEGAMGGISKGTAESSFRDVTRYSFSAPTAYIGESQEMQTAIVQRTVAVGFNQAESAKHTESFKVASAETNLKFMSQLGRVLLAKSLVETVQSRTAALDPVRDLLRSTMNKSTHDRQVYNLAVVICGLDFLGHALNAVFGDEFDDLVKGLRESLFEYQDELNTYAMSESSKVLNDMAMISRTEDPDSEFCLRETYEYVVGDGYMEIMVKESFVKYFAWCNRKGFKPLYTSAEGFIGSLSKSSAVTDLRCFESKLRGNSTSRVFRISLEKLAAEGVETFKSKSFG